MYSMARARARSKGIQWLELGIFHDIPGYKISMFHDLYFTRDILGQSHVFWEFHRKGCGLDSSLEHLINSK